MKPLMRVLAIFLILTVTACGSTVRMSGTDKESIRTVKINAKVAVVERMAYVPPGIGMLFGGIGAGITAAVNEEPGQVLARYARDNDVLIGEIVKNEFVNQLLEKAEFQISNSSYDAQLNIRVVQYGFTAKIASVSEVKPMLSVEAQLVTKANKVIWQNSDMITAMSGLTSSVVVEDIGNDANHMARAWESAAKAVVTNLISTM